MAAPLVVVQRISLDWQKESRGGPMASRRVQAMQSVRLPVARLRSDLASFVQMLNFCDWDAFAKPSERIYEYRETVSARPAELELKFDDERLNLRLAPFASSPLGHGNFVELGLGQTAKYEWNEKIAFMHTWRYRHTVVNVALTGQHPPARLFHSQPSFEATHLVQWY